MDKSARTWAMLLHFSVVRGYAIPFAGLIAPILIWQLKKEEYPEIDGHGKMVLNFLISMLIYSLVAGLFGNRLDWLLVADPLGHRRHRIPDHRWHQSQQRRALEIPANLGADQVG